MDKYEYRLKTEHIRQVAAKKEYAEAARLCDSIDWNKVRDVKMLTEAADIYTADGRYQDAIDVLIQAYKYAPIGRRIVYRLTELALEADNYEDANEYFDQFCKIAPHDQGRYILLYKMACSQHATVAEKIKILEAYKRADFDEKWAYELASLYARNHQTDKCVQLCDDIILWFGLGKYVEKALVLKAKYAPLTEQQQEKAKEFRTQKENQQYEDRKAQIQEIQGVPDSVKELQVDSELDAVGKVTAAAVRSIEREVARKDATRNLPQFRRVNPVQVTSLDESEQSQAKGQKYAENVNDSSMKFSQIIENSRKNHSKDESGDYVKQMAEDLRKAREEFDDQKARSLEDTAKEIPSVNEQPDAEPEEEIREYVGGELQDQDNFDDFFNIDEEINYDEAPTKPALFSEEEAEAVLQYAEPKSVEPENTESENIEPENTEIEPKEPEIEKTEFDESDVIDIDITNFDEIEDEPEYEAEEEDLQEQPDNAVLPDIAVTPKVSYESAVSDESLLELLDEAEDGPAYLEENFEYEIEENGISLENAWEDEDSEEIEESEETEEEDEYAGFIDEEDEYDDFDEEEPEEDFADEEDEYDDFDEEEPEEDFADEEDEYDDFDEEEPEEDFADEKDEYDDFDEEDEYDDFDEDEEDYDDFDEEDEYDDFDDEEEEYEDFDEEDEYDDFDDEDADEDFTEDEDEYDDFADEEDYEDFDDEEADLEYADEDYEDFPDEEDEYDDFDDEEEEYEDFDEEDEYDDFDDEDAGEDFTEDEDGYDDFDENEEDYEDLDDEEADLEYADEDDYNNLEEEEWAKQPVSNSTATMQINPDSMRNVWHFSLGVTKEEELLDTVMDYIHTLGMESRRPIPEQISRVTGQQLNGKDLVQSFDKLLGKVVIILNAADMEERVAQELCKLLEPNDRSILVILADTQLRLTRLFASYPQLSEVFTAQFMESHYTAAELLEYAKEYADQQDCVMDKAAELHLMERLDEIADGPYRDKKRMVETILAHAIEDAERKNERHSLGNLFKVRYSKEGCLILTVKNFQA